MTDSIIIELLHNTAILLAFAMLYENIWIKKENSQNFRSKIITGIVLGGIGIILMYTPWIFVPGIAFDTRSVMLSISGLFFGTIPTIIAMLITVIGRIYIGGDGVWMGFAVIISSGTIGLLWRRYRPKWRINNSYLELLAMGLVVHIVMSACTLLLPIERAFQTFKTIAIPLLVIYSPATMLLGLLMLKQSKNWENRLIQNKLLELERRLNQILESGNIISLMLNKEGNITFCNNYFLFLTGYSYDEILGKNWSDLFIPVETKEKFLQIFFSSLRNDNIIKNNENQILAKNGELLYVSWYNITLQSESDEILGTASIGVNITESKNYERNLEEKNAKIEFQNYEYKRLNEELVIAKERAEESEQLKTAFLNNISHEIRTPFNGILGFLQIIQEDSITIAEKEKYFKIISKSSERLMNTINDIVEISQIQARQLTPSLSEIFIKNLTDDLYIRFKPDAEKKGLTFAFKNNLPANILQITTDSKKLYSILSIIIGNAIKFTQKGSIEFGCNLKTDTSFTELSRNSELEFYVKDTGIGIPENKLALIFERFSQVDVSSTRKFEGSGLGLAIAKAYVEMLGGKIGVDSIEGKNSVFYITIPYCDEMQETRVEQSAVDLLNNENKSIKNLKVLIAEDDEISLMLLKMTVASFSKEVFSAATGIEAVEICRNNPDIDLIFMDIKMSKMDGYEATKLIRQFNKDVIIIAQTAYAFRGDREKAIGAGCNEYIEKPIKHDKLMKILYNYYKL